MHHPRRSKSHHAAFSWTASGAVLTRFFVSPADTPVVPGGTPNALAWYRSNADVFVPLRCVSTAGSCLSGWGSCIACSSLHAQEPPKLCTDCNNLGTVFFAIRSSVLPDFRVSWFFGWSSF